MSDDDQNFAPEQEPPEDSKKLRIVVLLMAILCVVASCTFVRTDWWMTALFLGLIVTGSFLSYRYRHDEPHWLKYIWWVGILLLGANGWKEFTGELHDEFDFVAPFVHFLAGVFVFVTFSMKTRSDLNMASGLGLMLLCLAAPVAKGLPYGACILGYLGLGALMMYFDCVSRTLNSWLSKPINAAPEMKRFGSRQQRLPHGNTILLIGVVPLLALAMFLYVPRADEALDKIWAYAKVMNMEYFTDLFFEATKPRENPNEQHTARSWFNKTGDLMRQLPQKEDYVKQRRKEMEKNKEKEKEKDKKEKEKEKKKDKKAKLNLPSNAFAKKDKSASPETPKNKEKEKPKSADKEGKKKEEPTPPPPPENSADSKKKPKNKEEEKKELLKKGEKVKEPHKAETQTSPEAKGKPKKEEQKEPEKKEPEKKGDKKKSDTNAGDKDKSTAKSKEEAKASAVSKDKPKDGKSQAGKGKLKEDAKKDGKKEGKEKAKEGEKAKDPAKGKDAKSADAGKGEKKPEDKKAGEQKGAGAKEGDKKGEGKDGKKTSGKGEKSADKDKKGAGKEGKGAGGKDGKKGGKGTGKNGGQLAGDTELGSDDVLVMENKFEGDDRVIMTVKSRRLVYLRRQCYDMYTGTTWRRAEPDEKVVKKIEPVRVVDGAIQRDRTVKRVSPVKAASQFQTGRLYSPSAPTTYGQQAGTTAPAQISVLSNPGANRPSQTPQPTPVQQPEPQRVVEDEDDNAGKPERPFHFVTTDKPVFNIGKADALKTEKALPTVELVQEIKVLCKSMGTVVAGGWVPQEIRVDQKSVDVDSLGVITCKTPITNGMEYKVKTALPIYPIEAMRQDMPISAQEEDEIRTRHARYLQLPDTVTEELFHLAETKADPRYNWFVQCQQIADYLRDNFKYDAMREVDPECKDLVQDFLFERKVGHCSDFASAFVILTRCIGVPSRLVGGFSPGDHDAITGVQEIRLKHKHAWAEAYIPQFGWVAFDATPDGVLPEQKRENRYTQKEVEKKLGLDEKKLIAGVKWTDLVAMGLAALLSLAVGFVAFKLLVRAYRRWREANFGRGPEWKLYKRAVKGIKRSTRLVRDSSETPTDFLLRVQETINERKAAGKSAPQGLPEALEKFNNSYAAVYFGKQLSELEHLKYHTEQILSVTKNVKMTDMPEDVESRTRPAKKEKITNTDAAAGAVRRKR